MDRTQVAVVHALPHRTRLRVPSRDGVLERAAECLSALPGVRGVDLNQDTGSLLVHHEVGGPKPDDLLAALCGPPRAYTIAHQVRGRLRIVPDVTFPWSEGLSEALLRHAGVRNVRVSCDSVVVTYDSTRVDPARICHRLDRLAEQVRVPAPASGRGWMRDALAEWASWVARVIPPTTQLALGTLAFGAAVLQMPAALSTGLLIGSIVPIAGRAVAAMAEERRLNADFLDGTAACMLLAQGALGAATFMTALIGLGEFIRDRTARRSKKLIDDLLGLAGQSAWLVRGDERICVPASEVAVDDVVVIYPGDMVPVDGVVLSGHAAIDQAKLTGESVPVEVSPEDPVLASTVNVEGKIYVRCTAAGTATRAARVLDTMNAAPLYETRIQNYTAGVADRLVLPIIAASAAGFVLTRDLTRLMSMLIFDFSTGIRIASPTAVLASMQRAGRNGILVKSGGALERLAKVDAVVLDKTGTLTSGEPHVTEIVPLGDASASDLLGVAAAVEMRLHHPAARAVVRYARQREVAIPQQDDSTYLGQGVRAHVGGRRVSAGSQRFMEQEGVDTAAAEEHERRLHAEAASIIYVAIDGVLAGLVAYRDQLRPEAVEVVRLLRERGVRHIVMATGDNAASARRVAGECGIDEIVDGAFPEHKAALVRQLKAEGFTVAVVGDGINDSPALAHADVAVSLRAATEAARYTADVVLTDDDLRRLPQAIDLARAAFGLVHQNLGLITVANGGGLVLAGFGLAGPAGATLLNNGSAILAAFNSLRPLYQRAGAVPVRRTGSWWRSLRKALEAPLAGLGSWVRRARDAVARAVAASTRIMVDALSRLRLVPRLRHSEGLRFFFFIGVNTLMNLGLTIGLIASEALLLSRATLGPSLLPVLFIATAIATAASTFLYSAFVDKIRNDRYFQIIQLTIGGALGIILSGVVAGLDLAVMAYFILYYVAASLFNMHFWTYAVDYFDAMEAKRLFPYFPLGNSVGGFLGGLLASLAGSWVTPFTLSLVWMGTLLASLLLIRSVSPLLKGWVVLDVQESDEASLSDLAQAAEYLRRSDLGRLHVLYTVLLVCCSFFLQYLYSEIFAAQLGGSLTAFLGTFLAITNLLEMLLVMLFTNRLINWLGVGTANLFYPLTALLSFGAVAARPGLPSAVLGRVHKETLENAVSSACRTLLYNAYPNRYRGRVRAFLEGAVTNVGVVLAGVTLLGLNALLPPTGVFAVVAAIGGGAAAAFVGVALGIQKKYAEAIVHGLREMHFDLDDQSLDLQSIPTAEILGLLEALAEDGESDSGLELTRRLFGVLLSRDVTEPLERSLRGADPALQLCALEALSTRPLLHPEPLRSLLGHGSAPVRARALELVGPVLDEAELARALEDAAPAVRAAAGVCLIGRGTATDRAWAALDAMLEAPSAEVRAAAVRALRPLGAAGRERMVARIERDEEPIQALALQYVDDLDQADAMDRVARALQREGLSWRTRQAYAEFLARSSQPAARALLVPLLEDANGQVRQSAIAGLARRGIDVLPAVIPYLQAEASATVEAALAVAAAVDHDAARAAVFGHLRRQLDPLLALVGAGDGAAPAALRVALQDGVQRLLRQTLAALERMENPKVVRNIQWCLASGRQARGLALEALSNLGDHQAMQDLVTLLESSGLAGEQPLVELDAEEPAAMLREGLSHPDRWIRAASRHAAARAGRAPALDSGGDDVDFERLLALKRVPLFEGMLLEQVETILGMARERRFEMDEIVFHEGEMGDELFIVTDGHVRVHGAYGTPQETLLATLPPGSCFGDMAVLDRAPRSATVVAETEVRLLSLSEEALHEIVAQAPDIAFPIIRVLCARLRHAGELIVQVGAANERLRSRLARGDGGAQPPAG